MPLDVRFVRPLKPSCLKLLDRFPGGSRSTEVDGDPRGPERGKRLGADVARDNRLGTQLVDRLGGLDACALRGIEVLRVVVGRGLEGLGIDQQKILGPPEARINRTVEVRSLAM